MFAGPSIETRDLRRWWIPGAVVSGMVAALTISAVRTVVAVTATQGRFPATSLLRCRTLTAR